MYYTSSHTRNRTNIQNSCIFRTYTKCQPHIIKDLESTVEKHQSVVLFSLKKFKKPPTIFQHFLIASSTGVVGGWISQLTDWKAVYALDM